MSDINVTFAGLPLGSPIAIEPLGTELTLATARAAAEAGIGAVFAPPLDTARLTHRQDAHEVTENNQNDDSRRESHRIVRRLNLERYLDEITDLAREVDIPIIAPLSCDRSADWLTLAEHVREAGAAAVEIRPSLEELSRTQRSDAIEKSVLRVTASVAGRIDIPVLVRIPAGAYGLIALVQALGESDAAAVTIRPRAGVGAIEIDTPSMETDGLTGNVRAATFHSQLDACRSLYRRVNPHLGLQLPPDRPHAMVEAALTGATVGVLPVAGDDPGATAKTIDTYHTTLAGWMRHHRAESLFDVRGILSESRMTSSLEH
ncbi:MAG: hypothetical protein ACOCYB_00975 [Alkalispirochaeta sp.]